MRIAVDARSIGPREVGIGVYARQLIEHLSRLAPGWTFHLYWAQRAAGTPVPGGPNVHDADLGRWGGQKLGNLLFEQVLLPAAVRRDRCDLLWSPSFVLPIWKTVPQVVTMHDVIPLRFAGSETAARRLVYHRLLHVNARQADRIITVSSCSAGDLIRYLGVEAAKIQVVHNGLEAGFTPLDDGDRQDLGQLLDELGIAAPYVLDTAGLLPRKNALGVLEAFARAADAPGRASLRSLVFTGTTAGGGAEECVRRLRKTAERLGIGERVHCVGFRQRDQLRLLYGGALCSIDASFYEGFGFPVLESMACGCPVITSRVSSLPEIAGNAALLVDPGSVAAIASALDRLLSDSALRQQLRERGLVRARLFSWEESARQTLLVLRGALGAPQALETAAKVAA